MNYRNTPEGRAVRDKYADLLPLSRPEPIKPRMEGINRAKIFSPFAALRGYEEEISDQDRVHELTEKPDFSSEEINALSEKLDTLKKGDRVYVKFFQEDLVFAPLGYYCELKGAVKAVDSIYQILELTTKNEGPVIKSPSEKINFSNIIDICLVT